MVPTTAKRAIQGLIKMPAIAATAPPIHGPKIGMMFNTPVMQPSAPGLGMPKAQNNKPAKTPIITHWINVPLIYPVIT